MVNRNNIKNRKRTRLREYDYSTAGWYYITICTNNMVEYFSKVKNEEMILNELGKIANKYWNDIPKHFPNVELDEYVIMPNHIHGIIIIDYEENVEDEYLRPKNISSNKSGNENIRSLRKSNLSNIIKGFKIGVTKWCKANNYNKFKWQHSFYDRVIRNEKELYNIRKYIQQNPLKWDLEKEIDNLNFY